MTRKRKIAFLKNRGMQIDYHRTTARLVIDAIKIGNEWHTFKTTAAEQLKAGQLIDKLFEDFLEE